MSASKPKNGNEDERRHETCYWSKAVLGLKTIKVSISGYITKRFQESLLMWKTDELEHLPHFFEHVHNICYEKEKKEWIFNTLCPICPDIFQKVLQLQQNPKSAKLAWNPDNANQKYSGSTLIKKGFMCDRCNICDMTNCIFHAERNGIDLQEGSLPPHLAEGHTKKALDLLREYYWRIGNMFMFHGKEKNSMKNTSPADTDPALVFKVMKNCNLFDKDDELYNDVLDVRNYLMHSSNQRIPKDDFDNCIEVFNEFLDKFEGSWLACYYGKREIDKLVSSQELRIENIKLSKLFEDASKIQKQAITFDIHISGGFGISVYELQGIFECTEKMTGNANRNQDRDHSTGIVDVTKKTLCATGGATTGMTIGAIAGPPGMIVGAAVGGLVGGLLGFVKK